MLSATAIEHDLYLVRRNLKDTKVSGAMLFDPWNDDVQMFPLSPRARDAVYNGLLAEDVRLDFANRGRLTGKDVGVYFTRYGQNPEYHARLLAHRTGLRLMMPYSPEIRPPVSSYRLQGGGAGADSPHLANPARRAGSCRGNMGG
jgi:hypothetical protein